MFECAGRGNMIKIFSKNLDDAIVRAREDEHNKCKKDKEHALEMQKIEIEGVWSITLLEKNALIQTMQRQIDELRTREKEVLKEKYEQRSRAIMLKHILSELHTISEQDDIEKMERSKMLGHLLSQIENLKLGKIEQIEEVKK